MQHWKYHIERFVFRKLWVCSGASSIAFHVPSNLAPGVAPDHRPQVVDAAPEPPSSSPCASPAASQWPSLVMRWALRQTSFDRLH